jgi:hypothetical protein
MKLSVAVAPSQAPDNAFTVFRGVEESIGKAAASKGVRNAIG